MDYAQRLLCGQILASTKKKASTPLHRGSKCVACCTLSWGTGRPPHHMQATTAPPDADSVTLSGKICGSPRSALFHSEPKQKVRKRAALEAIDALNHSPACCPCPPKKMAPTPFRGIDCRDKLHVASVLHQCGLWVKSRHWAMSSRCPLYPQKRTSIEPAVMSALCQKQTSPIRSPRRRDRTQAAGW
jgi:hypothetical protein